MIIACFHVHYMNCCGMQGREMRWVAVIDCETQAGPRHVATLGRLIIWHPFELIFFKLFLPKTGLAHAKSADIFQGNSFACGTCVYLAPYL